MKRFNWPRMFTVLSGLVFFSMLIASCSQKSYNPNIQEALQIANYSDINGNQVEFIDGSMFAILDSNLDAIDKGTYNVKKVNSSHYAVSLKSDSINTTITIIYRLSFKYFSFPDSIRLNKKVFYCNDLMCDE